MSNSRTPCGYLVWLLLLAIPIAGAQEPELDAALEPGESFTGKYAYVGDVDRVRIPVLPGASLSVSVIAEPGFEVRPRLELWADGVPVDLKRSQLISRRHGKARRIRAVPVKSEAVHEVRVTGGPRKLGAYRLKVREALPETLRDSWRLRDGEQQTLAFPVRAGATGLIRLSVRKGGAPPLLPELLRPGGSAVDLGGLAVPSANGRKLDIGPLTFTEDGVYQLRVTGSGVQRLRARIDLSHVSLDGPVVSEDPGHAQASGSVTLGDGYWMSSGDFGGNSGSFSEDGDFVAGEVLVQLLAGANPEAVARELGSAILGRAPGGWLRLRQSREVMGVAGPKDVEARRQVERVCEQARAHGQVLQVQPNLLRTSFSMPTDPLYPQQWDLRLAGFEAAWDLEQGNAAALIAVLDTGIRFDHPDFSGRLSAGYDFVGDAWNAGDGNGIDSDPTDPFVSMGTHGTHVAGTLAAATNNGIGVAGATSSGRVMPIRVLGILGGTDFDIAQGVLYAAGLQNASGFLPPIRAEVINMSLGGATYSPILHQAVKDAVAAGVVVVAAAGNSNSTNPMYPASFPETISVSATDLADQRTYYSSYGPYVDLAAPGGDRWADLNADGYPDGVLSTIVDPAYGAAYAQKTGTSMAAPHVAALAFLIRSIDPNLSPFEVEAYLQAGAHDLGPPGFDEEYGAGRIDAGRSVTIASGIPVGPGAPFAAPVRMSFSEDGEVRSLGLVNRGGGAPLQVLSVTTNAFWVEPLDTTGQTPCTLDVRVNSGGLLPGLYESELTIQTTGGTLTHPVELTVEAGGPIGVEKVYVVAIDASNGAVARIQEVTEETAELFVLDPLPEGTYRIVAATDLDRDGIAGESHDYTGEALAPQTGDRRLVLRDGTSLNGLSILLVAGRSGSLPGGGGIDVGGP